MYAATTQPLTWLIINHLPTKSFQSQFVLHICQVGIVLHICQVGILTSRLPPTSHQKLVTRAREDLRPQRRPPPIKSPDWLHALGLIGRDIAPAAAPAPPPC